MRKATKVWLFTATSLVLMGCILFASVMTTLGWDFLKLSTVKYETNTHKISEDFDGISINSDTADIAIALSNDGKCSVECYEDKKSKHSVAVENGILDIELKDEKSAHNLMGYIGINFSTPKITIYLPKAEYSSLIIKENTGDIEIAKEFNFANADISVSTGEVDFYASATKSIKIKGGTGDICVEDTSAGALELSISTGEIKVTEVQCGGDVMAGVSTGETYLTDINCKNIVSTGNTGDITLKNVIATEKFSVERSTGDVTFNRCDAAELNIKTSTGNVKGSLLSSKSFITETSTGSVDVPKTTTGGKCSVTTSTGDISILLLLLAD